MPNVADMQKTLLIILLIITSLSVKSQFSVGYRYGIGTHGVNLEPPTLKKYQTNYTRSSHGLVIAYNNMNNAGIQLEINFAQKGWKEVIDTVPDSFFTRNLDYIEIPIYSHFEIGHRMLRPTILFGPYIAWQINDFWKSNGFDDQFTNDNYPHYTLETRKLDFGLKIGAGLRLNINKRFAVFAEVHYDLEIAGGRDIFIDRPDNITVSRLTETSGVFGILWHIKPQKKQEELKGYTPKENLYDEY